MELALPGVDISVSVCSLTTMMIVNRMVNGSLAGR
jgi:hypothetical protein